MKKGILLFFAILNFAWVIGQSAPKVDGQTLPKVEQPTVPKITGAKSFGFAYQIQDKVPLVSGIISRGPAANAGLKRGDIITSVNEVRYPMDDTSLIVKSFAEAKDKSTFMVNRNGKSVQVVITKMERSSFMNVCISGNCKNGTGTFVDKDGHEYNGQFSNGSKVGTGKMTYNNGSVYDGQWAADRREGAGKLVYGNGDQYDGNWNMDDFSGEGTYSFKNGETYQGKWKAGKRDGNFIHYVKSTKETYIEVFKDGVLVSSKKEGGGVVPAPTNKNAVFEKIDYTNGDRYEGYVVGKKKEGFGKYTFKAGGYYEGNFSNDKINGFGKYDDGRGTVYEGNWKDEIKDGKGTETDEYGSVTQGNWVNGKLHGKIITTRKKDSETLYILEQQYAEGKMVGDAKASYPNGDVYVGEFAWGGPNGTGQFTYKNGDVEKGNFEDGKKMGLIEFKPKNGKSVTQYYRKNIVVGTYANGKLTFNNGDIFEGKFEKGLEEGPGKLITRTETISGNWRKGLLQGRAYSILKEDRSEIIYEYRDGQITSESFNPKKFIAQLVKFTENPRDKFQYLLVERRDNSYSVNEKLNGFINCSVKNYSAKISSTGIEKWVYVAETQNMTKPEALAMCTKLEGLFDKAKFSATYKKDVPYNVVTRRLVSYDFDDKLPPITLDAYGSDEIWTVTVSITK